MFEVRWKRTSLRQFSDWLIYFTNVIKLRHSGRKKCLVMLQSTFFSCAGRRNSSPRVYGSDGAITLCTAILIQTLRKYCKYSVSKLLKSWLSSIFRTIRFFLLFIKKGILDLIYSVHVDAIGCKIEDNIVNI